MRRARWWVVPVVALLVAGAVPFAAASGANDDSMATAALQAAGRFRELWNANKLEQLVGELYADQSVLIPPNHDAIHGRAAIQEYLQSARDMAGEYSKDDVTYQVTSGDTLASLFGEYKFRSGSMRFNAHELYQRQPDGSVRNVVDMFGFR
jgi:ketosteroid isomerase-like protein